MGLFLLVNHRADFLELGFWHEAGLESGVLEDSFHDSVFGYELEAFACEGLVNDPSFFFRMVVGTGAFSAIFILTFIGLVEKRMIRLFFPPMTGVACGPITTATQVVIYHLLGIPVDTGEGFIRIDRGVATVILPIMSVYALVFLVLSQVQNTELSLVVEHVEVLILNVVVDQFGEDLLLAVSIGAELSVGALGY